MEVQNWLGDHRSADDLSPGWQAVRGRALGHRWLVGRNRRRRPRCPRLERRTWLRQRYEGSPAEVDEGRHAVCVRALVGGHWSFVIPSAARDLHAGACRSLFGVARAVRALPLLAATEAYLESRARCARSRSSWREE